MKDPQVIAATYSSLINNLKNYFINLKLNMSDGFDYFNQLKGKVHELKMRRDEVNQKVLQERISMT